MKGKKALANISATRTLASMIGVFGGLMSIEHGYLETLQGNVAPTSIIIDAIGHEANSVFQGSEPALTLIPNFFVTGILAIIVGLLVTIWAAAFIPRKHGVVILMFSSLVEASLPLSLKSLLVLSRPE